MRAYEVLLQSKYICKATSSKHHTFLKHIQLGGLRALQSTCAHISVEAHPVQNAEQVQSMCWHCFMCLTKRNLAGGRASHGRGHM